MGKAGVAEKIIIERTVNHIKTHSSLMIAVGKKIVNDFPKKAGKLASLLDRIAEVNIIRPEPIEHEILQRDDPIECLSYMQHVGEQAEIDINTDLAELKKLYQSISDEESKSSYHINELLISLYQHGVGYIYKEVKNILFPKPNKNTM